MSTGNYQVPSTLFLNEVQKTNQQLLKIKELGIDTSSLEKQVECINNSIEQEIKDVYKQSETNLTFPLKDGTLLNIYSNGITHLKKIQEYIVKEYDTYVKIKAHYKLIESSLIGASSETIPSVIQAMITLIKTSNSSSLIHYDTEKKLVENIYQLAYRCIKIEISITGTSELLSYIKEKTDTSFLIEKHLLKEVNSLDKKDISNTPVFHRMYEIERNGLEETSYLDEELIKHLVLKNHQLSSINPVESKNELSKSYQKLEKKKKICQQEIKKIRKKSRKNLGRSLKKSAILAGYLTLVSSVAIIGEKECRKDATTTIKTENSRTLTTSDVNNLDDDLNDSAFIDLNQLGREEYTLLEGQDSLTTTDKVGNEKTPDLDNFTIEIDYTNYAYNCLALCFIIGYVHMLLSLWRGQEFTSDCLIEAVKYYRKYLENKKELKSQQQILLEIKKNLAVKLNELELLTQNKEQQYSGLFYEAFDTKKSAKTLKKCKDKK